MSKELEELKNNVDIKKALEFAQTCGYHADVQYALEKAVRLEQALTPPTADEVCKALSEYLQREVKMDSDNTFYYTEQRQIGECDEIICGYGWENEHHTIAFEFDLPPHLITLIGRFYEELEELK